MPPHHFLHDIRGIMIIVGFTALALTLIAWLLRFPPQMWWPIVVGRKAQSLTSC